MSDDGLVTVAAAPDLATAQVLKGALEAEEIACFLPDEQIAGQMWHLGGALGGVRVQVNGAHADRARAIIAGLDPSSPGAEPDGGEDTTPADKAAIRALRVALVGFLLWPFFHPYALSLSLRSLRAEGVSPPARRQARVALIISATSLVGFFVLLYFLLAG
jgi:hypothetical protein